MCMDVVAWHPNVGDVRSFSFAWFLVAPHWPPKANSGTLVFVWSRSNLLLLLFVTSSSLSSSSSSISSSVSSISSSPLPLLRKLFFLPSSFAFFLINPSSSSSSSSSKESSSRDRFFHTCAPKIKNKTAQHKSLLFSCRFRKIGIAFLFSPIIIL